MTTILAAIDASAAAGPVLHTAGAVGRTLRCPVVAYHVRQDGVEPERLLAARAGVELRLAAAALLGPAGARPRRLVEGVPGPQPGGDRRPPGAPQRLAVRQAPGRRRRAGRHGRAGLAPAGRA